MTSLPVITNERFPFSPFPSGWYALAFEHELPPGAVVSRTFAAQDVVIYRGESGLPYMLDAHCPHMGAHLGVNGRVEGETLRCPMHGFRFDGTGRCVATGYGTRVPPKCAATAHHVVLRNGVIFAWHAADGCEPSWSVPEQDQRGFGALRWHVFRDIPTHPQETTENSVDLGHLAIVHNYENVQTVSPLETDGSYLTTTYRMQRRPLVPGTPRIDATFKIHVHGLGYSFVDVRVDSHALRLRYFVLSTPTGVGRVDLHLGQALRGDGRWLGRLPGSLLERVLGRVVFHGFLGDVRQDLPIWSNKICLQPAALAEGDGPVGRYRSWARQFYEIAPAL